MRRMWILAIFLSFVCAHAQADTSPTRIGEPKNTCQKFTMCATQTIAGVCDVDGDTTSDEIVLNVFGRWSRFTFFGNASTGTPWSCDVFGNNGGFDAEGGDGVQLNTTALTNLNESITLREGDFGFIWVNCSSITTNTIITVNACPSNR